MEVEQLGFLDKNPRIERIYFKNKVRDMALRNVEVAADAPKISGFIAIVDPDSRRTLKYISLDSIDSMIISTEEVGNVSAYINRVQG